MSKYLIFCISLHKNEKFPPCVICLVCMQSTGPEEYKVRPIDFMYMINSFHKCLSFFYYKAFLSATHAWGGWISKVSNTFQKINYICTIQVEFSHICVYRTSVWHQYFFLFLHLFVVVFLHTMLTLHSNYQVAPVLMFSAKIWVKNHFHQWLCMNVLYVPGNFQPIPGK